MMKKSFRDSFQRALVAAAFFCAAVVAVSAASDPVVVEVHYQNGVKFYNRGMTARAEQEFQKTLELDPQHREAKLYLEKIKESGTQVPVVDETEDKKFAPLYEEGKRLYRQKNYEKAIEVFDRILKDSPIDKTASLYRERCEAAIARRLIREKNLEEKNRMKEESRVARSIRAAQGEEKKEISRKRKEITAEHKSAAKGNVVEAALPEPAVEREPAQKERQESIGKKQVKPLEEFKDPKELFLKGVEHYGRREHKEAVAAFQELIRWEAEHRKSLYTNASRRFMEKAKKKMSAGDSGSKGKE